MNKATTDSIFCFVHFALIKTIALRYEKFIVLVISSYQQKKTLQVINIVNNIPKTFKYRSNVAILERGAARETEISLLLPVSRMSNVIQFHPSLFHVNYKPDSHIPLQSMARRS
jgi:hypothetical protein